MAMAIKMLLGPLLIMVFVSFIGASSTNGAAPFVGSTPAGVCFPTNTATCVGVASSCAPLDIQCFIVCWALGANSQTCLLDQHTNVGSSAPGIFNIIANPAISPYVFLSIVLAVMAFGIMVSANVLSTGLNAGASMIVFIAGGLMLLWAALSFVSVGVITSMPLVQGFSLGSIFYALMSLIYCIGLIVTVRGAST